MHGILIFPWHPGIHTKHFYEQDPLEAEKNCHLTGSYGALVLVNFFPHKVDVIVFSYQVLWEYSVFLFTVLNGSKISPRRMLCLPTLSFLCVKNLHRIKINFQICVYQK